MLDLDHLPGETGLMRPTGLNRGAAPAEGETAAEHTDETQEQTALLDMSELILEMRNMEEHAAARFRQLLLS